MHMRTRLREGGVFLTSFGNNISCINFHVGGREVFPTSFGNNISNICFNLRDTFP